MQDGLLYEQRPHWWSDKRAQLTLGGVVCATLAGVVAMLVFVVVQGWPSFAHNGLGWFGSGKLFNLVNVEK